MSPPRTTTPGEIGPAGQVTPPLINVVLHEPEIPNNTGNIGRTCVATGCSLHLIRPLGFDTSEKACRRAGLDYWPRLKPSEHDSWGAFLESAQPADRTMWFFTTSAARPVWSANLCRGDYLVFGKETRGLPRSLLSKHEDRLVALPMVPDERSLNLATAVCAGVYEAIRQMHSRGEVGIDANGRLAIGAPASNGSRVKRGRTD